MGTINTLPVITRKTSEFPQTKDLVGQIIIWPGSGNLQRIETGDVADQLLTLAQSTIESITADKLIAVGDNFFQLISSDAARAVSADEGVSAFINNKGSHNLTVGASTLLPGESAFVLFNGVDHEVVKLAASGDGTNFLTVSQTDLEDSDAYFYGGLDAEGNWQINKYLKSNLANKTTANQINNSGVSDLSTAWAGRTSLTYG